MHGNPQDQTKSEKDMTIGIKSLKVLIHDTYFYYMFADKVKLKQLISAFVKIFRTILLKHPISELELEKIRNFTDQQKSLPPRAMPIYK